MNNLSPASSRKISNSFKSYINPELEKCTHVFIRDDSVKKPLSSPYKGPYQVLQKYDKFFKVQLKNKCDTICIDRLKPAFTETEVIEHLTKENIQSPLTQFVINQQSTDNLSNRSENETNTSADETPTIKTKKITFNNVVQKTRSGRLSRKPLRYL